MATLNLREDAILRTERSDLLSGSSGLIRYRGTDGSRSKLVGLILGARKVGSLRIAFEGLEEFPRCEAVVVTLKFKFALLKISSRICFHALRRLPRAEYLCESLCIYRKELHGRTETAF